MQLRMTSWTTQRRSRVFDVGTAAHVRAHPTVAAFSSRESLVKLESQAVIGHDSTLPIEKDHAGSKRTQVSREQTHRERLELARAARVTRHVRVQADLSWIGRLRQQSDASHGDVVGGKRRGLQARLVWRQKRNGGLAQYCWTRKLLRKHSTWQAWTSDRGVGDSIAYRAAMQRPQEGGVRRARKDRSLRHLREKWRR